MEELFTLNDELRAALQTLQRRAKHNDPTIQVDGQLNAQSLSLLDQAYNEYAADDDGDINPRQESAANLPSERLKALQQTQKDLLTLENLGHETLQNHRIADQRLQLQMTLEEQTGEFKAMIEYLGDVVRSDAAFHTVKILTKGEPKPEELVTLQKQLDIYHPTEDLPIEPTLKLGRKLQLDNFIEKEKVKIQTIDDYWSTVLHNLGRRTAHGTEPLESAYNLKSSPQTGEVIVHYSFHGQHAVDVDFANRTSSYETTDIETLSEEQQRLFRSALQEVSTVTDVRFVEVRNGEFPPEAINRWQPLQGKINDQSIGAFASYPLDNPAPNTAQCLVFDTSAYDTAPSLRQSMLHEIGHAMGLKHTFDPAYWNDTTVKRDFDTTLTSVMSYTDHGEGDLDSLRPLDIAALQRKYGVRQHNIRDTSYVMGDKLPIRVIHDTGGYNVIDASERKEGISVDISGELYRLKQTGETVRITQQTHIAEAYGSKASDTFYSGTKRHLLRGNGGGDVFHIPSAGKHFIDGFSPDEDVLWLPEDIKNWKVQIKDGLVQMQGTSRLSEKNVSIFLTPVAGGDLDALKQYAQSSVQKLTSQIEEPAPDRKEKRYTSKAMKEAVSEIRNWMNHVPVQASEVADFSPDSASRISAQPTQNTTPAIKR
jgi:hypothetical protein